jgi:acetyltransferase-like isoleucine patch superfamily enzyme
MSVTLAQGAWSHESVVYEGTAELGFCSCVGHGPYEGEPTVIGPNVRIGAFCLVEHGARIAENVYVDHYCYIGHGVHVGAAARILYRAQIFDDVRIGRDCIIAGELVDRTVVGDQVTFQGNTAHVHADPTRDWDTTEEPSPVIHYGSVVGIGALLVGGIEIGPRAYIAAGEIVHCNVPSETVVRDNRLWPLAHFRGLIKVRG